MYKAPRPLRGNAAPWRDRVGQQTEPVQLGMQVT